MNMKTFHFAIAQHYQDIDLAIEKLTLLAQQGCKIDNDMINAVFVRYGLNNDGFTIDFEEIKREVKKRLR